MGRSRAASRPFPLDLGAGSWKLEAGSWKLEAGSWKLRSSRLAWRRGLGSFPARIRAAAALASLVGLGPRRLGLLVRALFPFCSSFRFLAAQALGCGAQPAANALRLCLG